MYRFESFIAVSVVFQMNADSATIIVTILSCWPFSGPSSFGVDLVFFRKARTSWPLGPCPEPCQLVPNRAKKKYIYICAVKLKTGPRFGVL